MEGWIKLHRRLKEWEWYKTPNMVHLFIHLLLTANHQKGKWQNIDIQRGQLVGGRNKLAADTGLSPQSVRTCLGNLQLTNEITIHPTNLYSIITINKYDSYQISENNTNQPINQQNVSQSTNGQPTNQPQTIIYKNNKEEEEEKEEILKEEKNQVEKSEQTKMTPEQEKFYKERDDEFIKMLEHIDDDKEEGIPDEPFK
jgi:hypothetical protein